MNEPTNYLKDQFAAYRQIVVFDADSKGQSIAREAFYAGAMAVVVRMLVTLERGGAVPPVLAQFSAEIDAFPREVLGGVAPAATPTRRKYDA